MKIFVNKSYHKLGFRNWIPVFTGMTAFFLLSLFFSVPTPASLNENTLIDSNATVTSQSAPISSASSTTSNETTTLSDTSSPSANTNSNKTTEKSPETKLAQAENSSSTLETTDKETSTQSTSSSSSSTTTPTASSIGSFSSIKMDPQVNTGIATTSIPIEVPPGRKDMAPRLSLNYSSNRSNGWLGVGWMLDLGAIQRETRWGLDYSADDYVFAINDSRSELVPRGDWGADYYGAKIEGEFSKYRYDSITEGWIVTAKNGTKYYFGSSTASRQDDPTDPDRIFKWCLDRVEDTNGNYMTITYSKDQGERYLSEIKYTGNTKGLSPTNSIKFILESSPRTDAYEVYTTHFSVKTAYRLKTIEVYGNGQLARKYELNYTYSPSTNRSLLSPVTLYGSSGGALPSVTFTYSETIQGFSDERIMWYLPAPEFHDNNDLYGIKWGMISYFGTTKVYAGIADMNGDGLPDRVSPYGDWFGWQISVYPNNGGSFDNEYLFNISDEMTTVEIRQEEEGGIYNDVTSFDMNGDGLPDKLRV